MNKEILLVVNYYNESIIDFEKQLKPTHEIFENIVICNKTIDFCLFFIYCLAKITKFCDV